MADQDLNAYISKDFLYDELPCGFISFKPDGTILSVNKTLLQWVGLAATAIPGQSFKTLLTKSSMLYYNLVIEPLLNLKPTVNEINLKFNSQNRPFDALLNAVSYKNAEGNLIVINATVQKITDRKQYENELLSEKRRAEQEKQLAEEEQRKFEFLFNSVPNQIWTADPNGRVLKMNDKLRHYFGTLDISQEEDSIGVFIDDRNKVLDVWKNCLATGKKFERELRLYGASKVPEWFLVYAEPYYHLNGEIDMWFGSNTNINKQKLLQIANQQELKLHLSAAYEQLSEKSELLVSIANTQSHMVRKPLANILGLAALLNKNSMDTEAENILSLLLQSVKELDEMVRQTSKSTIS
jgi:PAS domain S-box-containing protein